MQVDLGNRVALVTGSSRGIGKSIALGLAEHGAHVVLAARTVKLLQEVEEQIVQKGGEATAIPTDIGKEDDILSLFDLINDRLGHLDILVNNAAVGTWGELIDFSMEDFDRIMNINIRSLYIICQQAMRLMIPRKTGFIINLSSVVGFKGYPKQSAYTASKHAVMGLTKSLAVEAQKFNIQVSAIQPGGVATEFATEARPDLDPAILIKPQDIANTVLYLLSLSDRAMVDQIHVRRRNGTPFIGV
jgi:3-oxoacyl-[acyl-carrier protein] reductase